MLKVFILFLELLKLHLCVSVPIGLQVVDIVLVKLTRLRNSTICLYFLLERYTRTYLV